MRYRAEAPPHGGDPVIAEYLNRELNRIAQTLVNPDPLWDDLRVSLTAARAATYTPGFSLFKDNGAGSRGAFAWHFDAASIEELFFDVQLPHAFREKSGVIRPHLHWAPTTTNTGTVRWGLEYTTANYGDTFGNTTIVYAEQAGGGTAYDHQIAAWGDIDASAIAISGILMCRLFRDATHANDTYTGDAAALSFDFHIQLDAQGSELEYIKRRPGPA